MADNSRPSAVDAERALLGAILLDSKSVWPMAEVLASESFYVPLHSQIFRAMKLLVMDQAEIDTVSVSHALKAVDKISHTLLDMQESVPSAANAEQYVRMIAETENKRRLLNAFTMAGTELRKANVKTRDVVRTLEKEIQSLRVVSGIGSSSMRDWLRAKHNEMLTRTHRHGISWLASGFDEFDRVTDGYRPKDFIVMAARPNVGKTALALNKLRNMAHSGKRVAMMSLEQEHESIYNRLLTAESQVNYQKIRSKHPYTEMEQEALTNATERLYELPLKVLDPRDFPDRKLETVFSVIKRLHDEQPLDFLVIDHARNFDYPSDQKRFDDRIFAGQIAAATKELANELEIPVMMLVHIGRQYEMSKSQIPSLSDLKDTGKWEEVADIVELIFRFDPDKTKKPTIKIGKREFRWDGMAFNKIGKNRDGITTTVPMVWRGDVQRFENYVDEQTPVPKAHNPAPEPDYEPEEETQIPF